jgi:hypothetical protein
MSKSKIGLQQVLTQISELVCLKIDQIVQKLSQNCQKNVSKLSKDCQRNVSKLSLTGFPFKIQNRLAAGFDSNEVQLISTKSPGK